MKKFLFILFLSFICFFSYSQMKFDKTKIDDKIVKSVVYQEPLNFKELPKQNKIYLTPLRSKDDNIKAAATVSYIAFATVLTITHFADGNEQKKDWPYWGMMGGLTLGYIGVVVTIK